MKLPAAGIASPTVIQRCENISLKKVAKEMSIQKSTATAAINRLENAGYVSREYDNSDRRTLMLKLTPLGYGIWMQADEKRLTFLNSILERLEPEDKVRLIQLLEVLSNKKRI
ncbi:MarR family winged helix-turn-helix transcriptional regulator [Paenibacillus jilunlii]|uniref:DNA-binding transcriptional regulator, MarR family n=1 Tax=Paenibacillus jilunlii TaxID=682956 RepID=A0A1G9KM91_9BACL|nr:MarR family transcriptional regulator [Paenibacillus jilunlii]KWX69894.1 hypothetical protein AML91_29465 [Paenibacillus jilunlii]SDL50505.1 DNA-binding transcriptional regulator, MarR family [Paenibacillus jilunlii]